MMRNRALSPYISAALVIFIGVMAISLSLGMLRPTLNRARDSAILDEAIRNMELIDSTIRGVASEGEGSRRTIYLRVTEGTYRVDSDANTINFTYRMKEGLDVSGRRGRINIARSGKDLNLFIRYTNLDLLGTPRFARGMNSVIILHNGTNPTTNHPMIYIGRT